MPALEVKNVTKAYGGFKALNGVDLAVEAGEIRALIGPNGAGKSTLIDVISGRAHNWTGEVRLFERNIGHLAASQRRLIGVSRSFQRTSIFPNLTVRCQLRLAAERVGGADSDSILEEFGLAAFAERNGGTIGYGDQRRLDLALALVGRPSLLLLDEPAAGLSLEESQHLAEHLRALARRWNVTVVLVEHDMEVVFSIADRITVLQLGAVLAQGIPDEIRRNRAVVEAYLGSAA
ncbi:MAG TPA: ABC transporter ATP-binding protein [Xanthobacteraceae bacterium]|nr:ABC transporter ATP-binding protein [Xanthobacteraceae bacterium]